MATTINADTSDGLKLTADTSGEIELQSEGTTIATVSSTGLAMASGKTLTSDAPSFSARLTSGQSVVATTFVKILMNVETWDTNSDYDTSLSRFTPTVAGYYQFNANAFISCPPTGRVFLLLFKNGVLKKYGGGLGTQVNGGITYNVVAQLDANGSSDYFEFFIYQEGGANQTINPDPTLTWWDGFLARAT